MIAFVGTCYMSSRKQTQMSMLALLGNHRSGMANLRVGLDGDGTLRAGSTLLLSARFTQMVT